MRFRTNHDNNNANSIQTDRQTDRSDALSMMLESDALQLGKQQKKFLERYRQERCTLYMLLLAHKLTVLTTFFIERYTDRQTGAMRCAQTDSTDNIFFSSSDTFSMLLESDALIIIMQTASRPTDRQERCVAHKLTALTTFFFSSSDAFSMMLESDALIINTTAFAITCASGQTTLIIMQTVS